jgi:glycosyltransferase involved in cell wall biosynthesis
MKGNQKRQTVVHMIPRLYPGGAERLVLEYARRSDTKKERMYVMSSVGDGALRPYFEQSHAELFVGSRQDHGGRLGVWRVLKKQLQQIQPTILHTHLLGGDMIGYFWKRCTPSVKWVVTLHNVEHHTHWIKRVLWKHILKKADAIIAVSPAVARYAREEWHIPEHLLTVVPNGIDLTPWQVLDTGELFDQEPYQVATIGRLEEQKGHTYLLQSLAGVKGVSWEYHIFGDGSWRDQLESQALQLGIADNVYFHGNVDNVAERLATIDLVAQPSLWEGMSLTVMEAMASGRVVLTTVPAGEGLIEDRQTGYIVPEADSDALARVLEEISQATDMARGVAHAGRSCALSNFGIEKHIEAIHVVYQCITRNDA